MRKLTRNEMLSSAAASRRLTEAFQKKLQTVKCLELVEQQNLAEFKRAAAAEISTRERMYAQTKPLE